MDVDLSTDLTALMPLVAPLISGHSDIAIGSRLAASSRVVRGPKREFVSRSYNLILRGVLGARFSDAQCGFKAMRADVARQLLPLVADTGWFFDTELLVIAERAGLRIHEVPVDWVDDPDSRVDIVQHRDQRPQGLLAGGPGAGHRCAAGARTAGAASAASRWCRAFRTAWSASWSGSASSASPARWPTRCCTWCCIPSMGAQAANLTALLLTAIGNTAANRAFTFGIRGRSGAARHQLHGLLVFAFGLAITSGSLFVLHRFDPTVGKGVELSMLVVANLVATLVRFVALRRVFSARLVGRALPHATARLRSATRAPRGQPRAAKEVRTQRRDYCATPVEASPGSLGRIPSARR